MLAMLVGLVNGGILLLVIVSLMGEMPGLIRGHRGQGAGIMGHINRFFHHSRIGTTTVGVAIGWAMVGFVIIFLLLLGEMYKGV